MIFDSDRYEYDVQSESDDSFTMHSVKSRDGSEAYFEVKDGELYAFLSFGLNVEIWRGLLVIGARSYKDDDGETHTVKGTTEGIRRALKDDLLGDAGNIRACRSKAGPFQALKGHPEFRDLVVEPAPMPSANAGTATTSSSPTPTKQRNTPVSGKWSPPTANRKFTAKSDPDTVDLNRLPRGQNSQVH